MKKIFKKALEHKVGLSGITTEFCGVREIPDDFKKSKTEIHQEIRKKAEEKIEKELYNKKMKKGEIKISVAIILLFIVILSASIGSYLVITG